VIPNVWRFASTAVLAAGTFAYTTPAHAADEDREVTVDEGEKVPNTPLIVTGAVLFGVPWGVSTAISVTSDHPGDSHLWVPLAGPWMDFADRGSLPDGAGHDREVTNRIFLAIDGVFQAVGALQIVGGFLYPVTRAEKRVRPAKAEYQFAPMRVGGGYGFGAVGTF
jgi:hypothetical protein